MFPSSPSVAPPGVHVGVPVSSIDIQLIFLLGVAAAPCGVLGVSDLLPLINPFARSIHDVSSGFGGAVGILFKILLGVFEDLS